MTFQIATFATLLLVGCRGQQQNPCPAVPDLSTRLKGAQDDARFAELWGAYDEALAACLCENRKPSATELTEWMRGLPGFEATREVTLPSATHVVLDHSEQLLVVQWSLAFPTSAAASGGRVSAFSNRTGTWKNVGSWDVPPGRVLVQLWQASPELFVVGQFLRGASGEWTRIVGLRVDKGGWEELFSTEDLLDAEFDPVDGHLAITYTQLPEAIAAPSVGPRLRFELDISSTAEGSLAREVRTLTPALETLERVCKSLKARHDPPKGLVARPELLRLLPSCVELSPPGYASEPRRIDARTIEIDLLSDRELSCDEGRSWTTRAITVALTTSDRHAAVTDVRATDSECELTP